jgi:hypothetical protein
MDDNHDTYKTANIKINQLSRYDTIHKLAYAHKSQGRGPESEARGRPAWEDGVKEKLKRSKKF